MNIGVSATSFGFQNSISPSVHNYLRSLCEDYSTNPMAQDLVCLTRLWLRIAFSVGDRSESQSIFGDEFCATTQRLSLSADSMIETEDSSTWRNLSRRYFTPGNLTAHLKLIETLFKRCLLEP